MYEVLVVPLECFRRGHRSAIAEVSFALGTEVAHRVGSVRELILECPDAFLERRRRCELATSREDLPEPRAKLLAARRISQPQEPLLHGTVEHRRQAEQLSSLDRLPALRKRTQAIEVCAAIPDHAQTGLGIRREIGQL